MTVPLPIDDVLPDIVAALRREARLIIRAPTGAGKSTRVPPALLDARVAEGRIIMVEPRRLAARAVARRMACERGTAMGSEIGYHVRFDRKWGPGTRLVVMTPGVLLRMLLDDSYLDSTGMVIFDEFHERGLESDLALGVVRLLQQTVRPDLRLVLMSATLEAEAVARALGDCPIVASEGRLHPVEIMYEPAGPTSLAGAVERLLRETTGDILVFLPGLREIRQAAKAFEGRTDLAVLPLHGDLPAEEQDAVVLPQPRRKVVLATNVAETSVTVEGVSGVVDTGLARLLSFDPAVGLDRLRVTPISRSSADQRAGRAGRTGPGVCIRLWSEVSQRSRPEQTEPEIRRVDLAGAVLHLLCLGEAPESFPWLDPPAEASVRQAMRLLRLLELADERGATELGRRVARLPVQPRLGRMLVEGQRLGAAARVALAAALLAERDPFAREGPVRHVSASDVLDRVEALEAYERTGRAPKSLNRGAARSVLRARDQLARLVRGDPSEQAGDEGVLRALLAGFPDWLARRREPGSRKGVMVGGRGVRLAPTSAVDAELFVCVDVDAGQTEAVVRLASSVQRDWLPADRLEVRTELAFDEAAEKVAARRRLLFDDLVIEESGGTLDDDDEVARLLAEAAVARLERVLPPPDSPAAQFLVRVRCLRQWLPELNLPAFDEAELRHIASELCQGRRSFADLRQAPWLEALQARLTPQQRRAVLLEAPERLEAPTGSKIALRYELDRPPVLAVRIQELFGLKETPRVAGGRVKVLLHLLAPNFRPQQVTDDLASFWANTYPVVRKELRARYPRHAWPEDPLQAAPQRGPRRRS